MIITAKLIKQGSYYDARLYTELREKIMLDGEHLGEIVKDLDEASEKLTLEHYKSKIKLAIPGLKFMSMRIESAAEGDFFDDMTITVTRKELTTFLDDLNVSAMPFEDEWSDESKRLRKFLY